MNRSRKRGTGTRATSLDRYVVVGLNMSQQNMSQQRRIQRDGRTNGVISVDLETAGFSRDIKVFESVRNKLNANHKKLLKKNFALSWREEFEWLYLRENVINGAGQYVFAPAWICSVCNKYYSENPKARIGKKNMFANGRSLLNKPPQKSGLAAHGTSDGHIKAVGTGPSGSDTNVFQSVYFEGYFNIPALTHPFLMYLVNEFGADSGLQLHSPNTAKKITVAVGCIVKAAVVATLKAAPFITFGEDGADIKDGINLFWIWARAVVHGQPIQLFWAVRREVRQLASVLFDVFMDTLSGNDINYGYDYVKKIQYERISDYNDEVKKRAIWSSKDLREFKTATNTKILKDFDEQYPGSIKIGEKKAVCKTLCNVSDGAMNQFGEINGFNGLLMKEQKKYLGTVIVGRVHCDNHEWDSELDINGMTDIIEECRRFMEYVDVYEEIVGVAVLYDVKIAKINKYFNQRWLDHINKAFKNQIINVDLLIYGMIWNLNKIMNRNDVKSKSRREFVLGLLQKECDKYWDFMIFSPIIEEAKT